MEQSSGQTVSPFYTSSGEFRVEYENSFVFSDEGKHLIGVDAGKSTQVRVEDITTGSGFSFGKHGDVIYTLIFDEDSGSLVAGDKNEHLVQYHLDLENKKSNQIKNYGDLGIESITSSFLFNGFVFIGAQEYYVKVLNLSQRKILPGEILTGVEMISSLQVCVVDNFRIFLAVVGSDYDYSSTESDLYEVHDLLKIFTIPSEILEAFEYIEVSDLKAKEAELLQAKKTISLQEDRIKKLSKENNTLCILEKKLKKLQKKLAQKESDHEVLIKKSQFLSDQIEQLKKDKVSQDNTLSDLRTKISEIESKLVESKQNHKSTLQEKDQIQKQLKDLQTKADAEIKQLFEELTLHKKQTKAKKSCIFCNENRKSSNTHRPEDIVDLTFLVDKKNQEAKQASTENPDLNEQIKLKTAEVESLKQHLKNLQAINIDG